MKIPNVDFYALRSWVRHFLLPMLLGLYPVFFHYGNNTGILTASELARQIPLFLGISAGVYILFTLLMRRRNPGSAVAAFVFLCFFLTYGLVFDGLRQWDAVRVDHFTLLPAYAFLGGIAAWQIGRAPDRIARLLWQGATVVLAALIAVNLIRIVSAEIRKAEFRREAAGQLPPAPAGGETERFPDIYYLIFDEMSGFEPMREYWGYDDVDDFIAYLHRDGFYVAESSRSETIATFHELAVRLNYQEYPYDAIDPSRYLEEYIPAISNSQAMQYLKSLGYTTIVFNEHPVGFLPFQADIVHVDPDADSFTWNSPFNDFGVLVMDSTMVRPILAAVHVTDAGVIAHAKRLLYIEQNVTQPDVPSPKFVYVHVLLPHSPFMFDENGNFIPLEDQYDWDKYLGMYIYSIRTAERMIADILASRSGGREVVIILQSDHGARNFQNDTDSILLENFPAHFSYSIVNAIRMPGCDESVLAQDFDPINTFPVIFNCYFNAEVPLQ